MELWASEMSSHVFVQAFSLEVYDIWFLRYLVEPVSGLSKDWEGARNINPAPFWCSWPDKPLR